MLHWGDLWHALAPSFPSPGPHGLLLSFLIVILVRPIHLLLQIAPGPSQAAALEHLARAELGAESNEGEALAALLLLENCARGLDVVRVDLVHAAVQHRAKQAGDLVDLGLHLRHHPPEPAEGGGAGSDLG